MAWAFYANGAEKTSVSGEADRISVVSNAGFAAAVRDTVPAPLAWWRLGETSGAPQDSSGNGYHMDSMEGDPTYGNTAAISGDPTTNVDFDGTGDYATKAYSAALNTSQFSICAWIRRDTDTGAIEVIYGSHTASVLLGFTIRVGTADIIQLISGNGAAAITSTGTTTISTGQWYFVVGTCNSTSQSLYVNGVLEDSDAVAYSPNTTLPSRIASASTGTTTLFNGKIQDVILFDDDLSAEEVYELYRSGTSGVLTTAGTVQEVIEDAVHSIDVIDSQLTSVQAFTASGTIKANGGKFVTFTGAASQTLTLPAAQVGLELEIINIEAADFVTITRAGTDTINLTTSVSVPPGGKASLICYAAGLWSCHVKSDTLTTSGGMVMTTTTLSTIVSLSLPPGTWNLWANGWWDVSTAGLVTYVARLHNVTDATEIYRTQFTQGALVWQGPYALLSQVELTATKTIAVQVAPTGLSGTQLAQDVQFLAQLASPNL